MDPHKKQSEAPPWNGQQKTMIIGGLKHVQARRQSEAREPGLHHHMGLGAANLRTTKAQTSLRFRAD